MMSFNLILLLINNFFFSTKPTAKPAKSNLFLLYVPGISAVSPPIKAQSANLHPATMPSKIFFTLLSLILFMAI